MKKPIIGITLDFPQESENNKYSPFAWYALRKNYIDSIIKAGGLPICLPYDHSNMEQISDLIDGLIIPGGDSDLNPELYKQSISSNKLKLNKERSKFDVELFEIIKSKNIPFLGICYGMQLMNISFGGDLIQHIPDYLVDAVCHEQPHPKNIPSHIINIKKDTMLHNFAGNTAQIMVNSTHHQAIGNVGTGLVISATAEDGIIEAIEAPAYRFMLGVQWHPEYLSTEPLDINLFKGIVEAARIL